MNRLYRSRIDADLPPPRRLPLTEFARQSRDLVDLRLRTPQTMDHSDGRVEQVAPVDDRFQLDRVLLRMDMAPPEIHIIFRWAGEQTPFGVREKAEQHENDAPTPEQLASLIVIFLEENLLASGLGIKRAIRRAQDDVTWLDWSHH
jgi:hypothetical protein